MKELTLDDIINDVTLSEEEEPTYEEPQEEEGTTPELPPEWTNSDEMEFQEWYAGWAKEAGINPNPDDPRHFYDYRAAYKGGAAPEISPEDGQLHWPSAFKLEGHPRMVVDGVNTKTGQPVDQAQREKAERIKSTLGGFLDSFIKPGNLTPEEMEQATSLSESPVDVVEGAGLALPQKAPFKAVKDVFGGGDTGDLPFGLKSFEQFGRMALRAFPDTYRTWNDLLFLAPLSKPEETLSERVSRDIAAGGVEAVTPFGPMDDPHVRAAMMAAEPEIRENVRLVSEFFPKVLDRPNASIAEQILTAPAAFAAPMALSAFSGGAGLVFTFMTMYGNVMEELEKQGVPEERAREAATFIALTTTPLEFAGNMVQIGAIKKALSGFAKKAVKAQTIGLVEAVVQSAISEGLEEFLQQYFEVAGLYYAANPDLTPAQIADYIFKTFDKQTMEALKAAGIGAASGALLTGAIVGGAKSLEQYKIRKDEQKKDALYSAFERKLKLPSGTLKAAEAEGKSLQDLLSEEDILPKPEGVLKDMGAISEATGEEGAPAAEKKPVEEDVEDYFTTTTEAKNAGRIATPEMLEEWTTAREAFIERGKFFTETGQHKQAMQATLQAKRLAVAIETAKTAPVEEGEKPKLETVTIRLRGLPDLETKVQVNPSVEQASALLKKSKVGVLRGVISDRGDLYFWDAYDATHSDFMGAAGINPAKTGTMWETYFLATTPENRKQAEEDIPEWAGNSMTVDEILKVWKRIRSQEESAREGEEQPSLKLPPPDKKAAKLVADMNGQIVEQEEKTGELFDFDRKEDQDWLKSLGYTEPQILQARKSAEKAAQRTIKGAPLNVPEAIPGARFAPTTAKEFNKKIDKAPYQEFLTRYSDEELSKSRLYTRGDAGYAIAQDGEIFNVFNATGKPGMGKDAVQDAIKHGGTKLFGFEGVPTKMYRELGFVEYDRAPWNPEYAPKNWNYEKFGTPDVLWMRLPGTGPKEKGKEEEGEKPKLEKIDVKLYHPTKNEVVGTAEVAVQVNPTTSELEGMLNRSKEGVLRAAIDFDNNLYVWDAYDATHYDIMKTYGVKYSADRQFQITASGKYNVNFPEWRRQTSTPAEVLEKQKEFKAMEEQPKLGKTEVDEVTILDHGGREYSFRVLVNPSRQRLEGLLKRSLYRAVRVMINPKDGTVYAWGAEHAIHADIADYYGFKVPYEQGWTYEFVGEDLFDINYAYENFLRDLRQGFPEALLLGGIYAARDAGTVSANIAKAEQLESEGKSRKDIWKATGWVRGPGGQWRFEIDDSKAKLEDPGKPRSQKVTEEEKGWRWHATNPDVQPRFFSGEGPTTEELLKNIMEMQMELAEAKAFVSPVRLADVLDHPELYRLYPQLKTLRVLVDSALSHGGYFEPATRTIAIAEALFLDKNANVVILNTIFHEIQHAIQRIEGFPVGSSPNREFSKLRNNPDNANYKDSTLWKMAYGRYTANAGENEALDVEKRLTLNSKQRKNIPPYELSEREVELPMKQWIIRREDGTAFQINTHKALTRTLLEFVREGEKISDVALMIKEAAKEVGLTKFTELMNSIDVRLTNKVTIEKVSQRSVEEYANQTGFTRGEIEEALKTNIIRGSFRNLDELHALIQVSLSLNKTEKEFKGTFYHESWHMVERWFFTDEEMEQLEKWEPDAEKRADDFAKYIERKLPKTPPSWIAEKWDQIIWFLKVLRAKLLSKGITSMDELYEWVRRGEAEPKRFNALMKDERAMQEYFGGKSIAEFENIRSPEEVERIISRIVSEPPSSKAEAAKHIKIMVNEWSLPDDGTVMPVDEPSLDTSGWTPERGRADVGDEDRTLPHIMELPEILELYKMLMQGKAPGVRKLLFKNEGIRGVFMPGKGIVRLKADIFKDSVLASRVLAHEIGHIVDWLPDFMIKGSLLGKISSIKNWAKNTLPFKPGAPGELTEADRIRLREEAIKLLGVKQILRTKLIDTTITQEVGVSPEDVLKIWNAVVDSRQLNPDLYKYIAGLDSNAKKLIIKAALRGELTEDIKKFVKTIKVGPTTKKEVTEVIEVPPSQEEIAKKFADLIEKEIRLRRLWVEQEVRDELTALSARWRPWDASTSSARYRKYRASSEELYADAISVLFNDPQFLKAQAPKFYEAFFNYIENKPEVRDAYLEVQRTIHAGLVDQRRVENFYQMMDKGNDAYGLQYSRDKIPFSDDIKRAMIDTFHFIIKDIKVVGEENIPDHLNPRYKLEEMVYTPSEIEALLTELYHNIIKPLHKVGLEWDREFGLITYLMRVAFDPTIQGQAHPQGWTKEIALEKLKAMRDVELRPEQWEALKKASKAFRKIHEEYFIDKAEDNEVYDKEMIKQFRDNDTYATWDVMPYLEARYGRAVATRIFSPIGTLQDIANPATATIMKDVAFIKAVNRNIAVRTVVKFYQDYSNILGIDVQEAPRRWNGKFQEIQEPDPGSNLGLVTFLHKGKAYGYWLPKTIAEAVTTSPLKHTFTARALRGLTNPMRQIFTNLNYGFWVVNAFFRDAQRFVMALPGWRVDKFVKYWNKGIKPSFRSTFGIPDDVALEMQKNNMLISVTDMKDLAEEDTQIERLLRHYHIKGPEQFNNKIIKPWGQLFNYITNRGKLAMFYFESVGRALERTTKVATYMYLTERFPDLSKEAIGHIVRTRGGSPDFWRAGREHSILNNLLMFINAQKEGYRGDWEAFKENPGEFAAKKMVFMITPKLLMYAGILGLLGPAIKEILDGVSEYDLTNYLIIPIGLSSTGRAVYWRVPTDELSRLVGGVLWKAIRTVPIKTTSGDDESLRLGEGITHLMDYAAGQVPTVSPLIGVMMDVIQYSTGQNPYDTFYGRHAMGEVEFQAKDARARKQMLEHVLEKLGVSIVYKFKHDKVEKIAEELEEILGFPIDSKVGDFMINLPDKPIISNVLGRFLKVSNYGEREKLLRLKDALKTENARTILDAREAAWALVDGRELTNEQVIALFQKPEVIDRQLMLGLSRKYGKVYLEEWIASGTKAEKDAVVARMLQKSGLRNQDATVAAPPPARDTGTPQPQPELPPFSLQKLLEGK